MLGICKWLWICSQDCAGRARTMSTFLSSGEVIDYILFQFIECLQQALMRLILSMPRKPRLRFLRWPPEPVHDDETSGLALSLFCLDVGGDRLLRGEVSLVHWWGEPGGGGIVCKLLSPGLVLPGDHLSCAGSACVKRGWLYIAASALILASSPICHLYLEDLKRTYVLYTNAAAFHLPRFQKSICFRSCPLLEFSLMWLLMAPLWAELLWRFASCSAAHSWTWFAALVHFEIWLKYPCSFALTWFPRLLRTSVPSALERRASASRVQLSTGSFPTSCARWLESVNIGSLNFCW